MRSARTSVPALLVAALLGACGGAPPPRRPAGTAPAPGIVLLCVDTLRSDAFARMPVLSAFATGSTVFPDAASSASWTAPGVATLLTGLEPAGHGVQGSRRAAPLAASVTTVAESLRDAGWHTAAATEGIWVSPSQGFDQGFRRFDVDFDVRGPERAISAWDAARPAGTPFFLFLHTYAAHDPYGPKPPGVLGLDAERVRAAEADVRATLEGTRGRPAAEPLDAAALRRLCEAFQTDPLARAAYAKFARGPVADAISAQTNAWLDGGWRDDPDAAGVPARLRAAYDEGLAWTDSVLERTLLALRAAGMPQGTVVAIVSDHGEAFGEHGRLGHGADLYDESVRVPLVLRAPGRLAPGVVPGSCGLVDVTPTLLDLAGVAAPAGLAGRSLLPLARGEAAGHPVVAEAETTEAAAGARRTTRTTSVRTEAAKYVVTWDVATREVESERVHDLLADPAEKSPLEAEGLGRFGARFCEAVGRVRSGLVPRGAFAPACRVAAR
jgi:arylsulfatase A-like enzyme